MADRRSPQIIEKTAFQDGRIPQRVEFDCTFEESFGRIKLWSAGKLANPLSPGRIDFRTDVYDDQRFHIGAMLDGVPNRV